MSSELLRTISSINVTQPVQTPNLQTCTKPRHLVLRYVHIAAIKSQTCTKPRHLVTCYVHVALPNKLYIVWVPGVSPIDVIRVEYFIPLQKDGYVLSHAMYILQPLQLSATCDI